MRIGINALYLLPGKVGGSEIYIRNLVRWLAQIDRENEYLIYINRESEGVFEPLIASSPNIRTVPCPLNAESRPARIIFEQVVLPFKALRDRLDVLLSAGMTSPFLCPVPSVLVIFDLQHVNQPENFPRGYLLFLRTIIYLSAKTSRAVVTISTKSKHDLERHYRIRPERIAVTYMAADNSLFREYDTKLVEGVRKRYDLPGRFILYIASSLPHKNYSRLLEAFRKTRDRVEGIKLVLIGARDKGAEVIRRRIGEFGLTDDVIFLGWLPFEDIPLIYSAAELFVFPSLHEGFGIPVLEAFACGVPVVCSKIEPIMEVAGGIDGAARLVNPFNVEEMASGMIEVLEDASLRERLIERGLERARGFSWEKTARETVAALERYTGAENR